MNAEHDKKHNHKKHGDTKKHEGKKSFLDKPHKKAEIDFTSSEFADSDSSDETPDDDQAEQGIMHSACSVFYYGHDILMI